MSLTFILILLALGILLIGIELFLIPGTTIVGIAGAILMLVGVWQVYVVYGMLAGNLSLFSSILLVLASFYWGTKMVSKSKLSLQSHIDGRIEKTDEYAGLESGQKGKTLSTLRPNGKAVFGEKKVEVYTQGEYLPSGVEIEIIRIAENKIFIKPLNQNT